MYGLRAWGLGFRFGAAGLGPMGLLSPLLLRLPVQFSVITVACSKLTR